MTPALQSSQIDTLVTTALQLAGLPMVPDLKEKLQNELSKKLFPTVNAQITVPPQLIQTALAALQTSLQQELTSSLQNASLAAIAELSTLANAKAAPQPAGVMSPEQLAGLSEASSDTTNESTISTTTTHDDASTSAPTAAPQPEVKPPDTQRPAPTPANQPATSAVPESDALPMPAAAPEETVAAYREREVANKLAAEKRRRETTGQSPLSAQQTSDRTARLNALANEGAAIGEKLKHNIKTGKFSSFFIALVLALTKDILEPIGLLFGDPGLVGAALSIFIGGLLTALLFSEGVWFRRWLVKKFLGKAIIAFIASLIPVVNIAFPEYTVGVLLMGYDNNKAVRRMIHVLAEHNRSMKMFERIAKLGGHGKDQQLAKAKAQLNQTRAIADE